MSFTPLTDAQLATIREAEPLAIVVNFPIFGECVYKRPKFSDVLRWQQVIKSGGDGTYIVRSGNVLWPPSAEYEATIAQEASGLPLTAMNAVMQAIGVGAEFDVGKR